MIFMGNSKKTFILAAVVSIMAISFVSSSQTNALSLRDVIETVTGSNQRIEQSQVTNQNRETTTTEPTNANQSLQNPIRQTVETLIPTNQNTTPLTPTPLTPTPSTQVPVTQNLPAQTAQQTPVVNTQQTSSAVETPVAVVTPVDTSADVLRTANLQSISQPAATGTLYTSNKLDPQIAQYMLIAAILTITAGFVLYGATVLPSKKRTRQISVKSL
jgi:hypothetical protein